ncbi:MAG: hypothetical protein KF752_20510 [Pirellulaceae bacterium]|nr:hypothetical protein [Pirellulaceae bacterium]
MIDPVELREKATRIYGRAIDAWLRSDESFFPYAIRANTQLADDHVTAIKQVDALRQHSKESLGFGYSILWQERKTRKHGSQRLPGGFYIESLNDLLSWIDKQREFTRLRKVTHVIRHQCAQLEPWLLQHWRRALEVHQDIEDLLLVANHLCNYPRPNCYPRELPLPVSTKLIERNFKLLAEWLDIVLPNGAIDYQYGRDNFAGRYGFRQSSPHFLMRLLDDSLRNQLCFPGVELSLPIETIAQLPVSDVRVFVVENRTNLLTLPYLSRAIALGGLGYNVSQFFDVTWLEKNIVYYWGDIDVDGFCILSSLRQRFPLVKSLMMDAATLNQFRCLIGPGNQASPEPPKHLESHELEAFQLCRDNNWRLEQEHVPQSYVNSQVGEIGILHRVNN